MASRSTRTAPDPPISGSRSWPDVRTSALACRQPLRWSSAEPFVPWYVSEAHGEASDFASDGYGPAPLGRSRCSPSNTEPVFDSGDAFEIQRVGAGARSSRRMRRSVAATGKPGSPTSRRFRSGLTAISTSEPAATVRPSASIVQPINLPIRLRSPAGVETSARNAQMPLCSSPRSSQRSN